MLNIEYKEDLNIDKKDIKNIDETIKANIKTLKTIKGETALIIDRLLVTLFITENVIVVEEVDFL